jgi:hypothetical protein
LKSSLEAWLCSCAWVLQKEAWIVAISGSNGFVRGSPVFRLDAEWPTEFPTYVHASVLNNLN